MISGCDLNGEWKIKLYKRTVNIQFQFYHIIKMYCDGRESNPGQLLGRQLC